MGQLEFGKKIAQQIKKYRYAVLVLVIGIILMLIPGISGNEKKAEAITTKPQQEKTDFAQQIEEILSQVQGAGKVKIMLTVAEGEKTVYQVDSDVSQNSTRLETVIVTGTNREQMGVVMQVNPAKYLGAIVVCQGADRAEVKLAVTQAVSRATGLGTDQISVLKMK